MSQGAYLALAISILIGLLTVFIVSFVIYHKTPAPKGCEDIKINPENCGHCQNQECHYYPKKEEE